VELFFDLSHVFACSQLVARFVDDPTPPGVARTLLLFVLIWLPWTQFHLSANAVSGNSRTVRMWFLVATVASIPMGASVVTAYDSGGPVFALSSAVILGMGLLTVGDAGSCGGVRGGHGSSVTSRGSMSTRSPR